MRQAWLPAALLLPFVLAGCSDESGLTVEAELLPGGGAGQAPLIFEVVLDSPDGKLVMFDPEQHVVLEVANGTLRPSNVIGNPENDYEHQEFGLEFTADRGQPMTLVVTADGQEKRFDFDA